jgi:hypothetical protein
MTEETDDFIPQKRMDEIMLWYKIPPAKFNLIKYTFNREMAVLVPSWILRKYPDMRRYNVRMLKCHSVQHLDFILERYVKMFQHRKLYNFYYTLAKYRDGIPNQPSGLDQRSEDNRTFWKTEHFKQMSGYDFLLDIDAGATEDIRHAFDTAKDVMSFFEHNSYPFEIRFSGRGFHFIVPSKFFNMTDKFMLFNPEDDDNIYKRYYALAKFLNERYSELIDINIYDSRRLCKIPFSLAVYEDDTFVCYPFRKKEDFLKFDIDDFRIDNFNLRWLRPEKFEHEQEKVTLAD